MFQKIYTHPLSNCAQTVGFGSAQIPFCEGGVLKFLENRGDSPYKISKGKVFKKNLVP